MSTKALIGIDRPEREMYEVIEVHWDGYPEHVLPILDAVYVTESRVESLLELGDIETLHQEYVSILNAEGDGEIRILVNDLPKTRGRKLQRLFHDYDPLYQHEHVYIFNGGSWTYQL